MIKKLFKHLDTLSYPNSMIKVKGEINGIAFFPGGKGTFDLVDSLSNKNIMILGQDFDCEKNYKNSLKNGHENINKNPTWRNLLAFLREVEISPDNCFFTNAIMGVRKGDLGTGKSPAFKDKPFIHDCKRLFLQQIELQKPTTIFVLGKFVAEFISAMSNELTDWNKIKNFVSIDNKGKQIFQNITFDNGIKCNLVLLTHPSFRNSNVHRRTFKRYTGNEAEKMMILSLKESTKA